MDFKAYERKVFYYETDKMAIVHHSNYIRWFEEARVGYMEQMGYSFFHLEENGVMIPVTEVNCSYKAMTRFGDTVLIYPTITEYTGTRMTVSYEVYNKDTGVLTNTGYSKHCFMSSAGKLGSLKKLLPEAHESFLNSIKN